MELFKDIATIVGCLISVITLITLCSKTGKNLVHNVIKKELDDLTESNNK